jgi:hypothetical protein
MENLPSFVRHFAYLSWLLVHRPEDQDEVKDALRRAVAELAEKRYSVVLTELTFSLANSFHEARLNDVFAWLSDLSIRMAAHSVRCIEFQRNAAAHDVLGLARALATQPVPGDEGEWFDEQVVALAPTTAAVHIGGMGFVRSATPVMAHPAFPGPARTPRSGVRVIEPGDVIRELAPTPEDGASAIRSDEKDSDRANIADQTPDILAKELAPVTAGQRLKDLLSQLDQVDDVAAATRLIDETSRIAEERARQGLWVDLAEILDRFHRRHDHLRDGDLKRSYQIAIRRLEKPTLMHGVAQLLPRRREMRDIVTGILARSGDLGADALIDLLVGSESATERRAYRSALAQCPSAVPALLHLLGDNRWYVVRNAVELLTELSPPDVDAKLAAALAHSEPRVRRAVAVALAKVGTARAVLALLQAVHDPSADVRLQVAHALGAIRNPRAVPWLIEALDKEHDSEVQAALVAALGRMPNEDAVARLARAVAPGGILLRKPTAVRLHAVAALAEAGTPSAQAVLRGLLNDRDREVREAADRALSGRAVAVPEN